ncbi:MAG: hypothetical protein ACE5HE_04380 [Phycisphaerae bacterium]
MMGYYRITTSCGPMFLRPGADGSMGDLMALFEWHGIDHGFGEVSSSWGRFAWNDALHFQRAPLQNHPQSTSSALMDLIVHHRSRNMVRSSNMTRIRRLRLVGCRPNRCAKGSCGGD